MTTLKGHLDQISLSARSIADLQFPPPKVFTNALLGDHEITTLIRDTEPHERALFSLDPNAVTGASNPSGRRATGFPGGDATSIGRKSIYGSTEPRQQSAVARVLGSDMLHEIQRSTGGSRSHGGGSKGVNVEVLLRGAEKLCAIYPVPGVAEKITALRHRHRQIVQSLEHYEGKVSRQQAALQRMNKGSDYGPDAEEASLENEHAVTEPAFSEQDLQNEEQEVRELEAKKKALEDRVAGMEKDLGGLLR